MGWNVLQPAKEVPDASQFWKKPSEIIHKTGLKVLIFGEPEVGKTHFALTFPEPIFVIDTEFGVAPLLSKEPFKNKDIRVFEACQLDVDTVEVDPIKSIEAVEQAITALQRVDKGTIVIDSATDIWQWLVAWLEVVASRRTSSGQPYRFESACSSDRNA